MRVSFAAARSLSLGWWFASALSALAQAPQTATVVNSATYQSGLPYGGALATVFVSGVTDPKYIHPGLYLGSPMYPQSTLGGIQVYVCQALAPILAVYIPPSGNSGDVQINFQVPLERNVAAFGGLAPECGLEVNVPGYASAGVSPLPQPPLGGFFTDGNGYVIATHASNNSPVTLSNPAQPGETINAFGDDIFQVWPEPPVGVPAPSQPVLAPLAFNLLPYLQSYPACGPVLGGITGAPYKCPTNTPPLTTTFLGMAPGQIGVEQVTFTVPSNQQAGNWPLFFNNGTSQTPYALLPVQ